MNSKEYGNFYFDYSNNKVYVWWDFYDEQAGWIINSTDEPYFISDSDIKDFTDAPADGGFKTIELAKQYLNNKFGEIKC